jgi:hypothetical protein
LNEFGAWKVKEVKNNGVIFEATKDTILRRSFEGFSITTKKDTIKAVVNWCFAFEPLEINEKKTPARFMWGTAWGHGK